MRLDQVDEDIVVGNPQAVRPWGRLDPALASVLAAELPALADEVIVELGRAIAEYRRPLRGEFGRGLNAGVQRALRQFVELLGDQGGPTVASREIYRQLGRGEQRAGRRLDALQAAYRVGARLTWQRLSAVARAEGADAATVSLLAESLFAYIDEISASSVEGYAQAQAELAGEHDRRCRRLVRLLVQEGNPPEERVLRVAALQAGWELPAMLAALVCASSDLDGNFADGTRLASLLGGNAIAARVEDLTCVLIPDPDLAGRREQIEMVVGRIAGEGISYAALGPTVVPERAAVSFRHAQESLRLGNEGVLPAEGLLVSAEHLLSLLLHRDATLAGELVEQRLQPLAELSPGTRVRLEETLLAWLRHQGSIPPIALELHVHRQTVRYRLGQLKELFGEQLDLPHARLEIELALRISAATEGAARTITKEATTK